MTECVYRRIINLWDIPRYRILHALAELNPQLSATRLNPFQFLRRHSCVRTISTDVLNLLDGSIPEPDESKLQNGNSDQFNTMSGDSILDIEHELEVLSVFEEDSQTLDWIDSEMDQTIAEIVLSVVNQAIMACCEHTLFEVDADQDQIRKLYLHRLKLNRLTIQLLSTCTDEDIAFTKDDNLNEKDNLFKFRKAVQRRLTQNDLIREYTKLVGTMTRLSLKDSQYNVQLDDFKLSQLSYNCSRQSERHERKHRRVHHHDYRRRKIRQMERRRRRKKKRAEDLKQQHHKQMRVIKSRSSATSHTALDRNNLTGDEIFSTEDDEEHEEVSDLRRQRWREMERMNKDNIETSNDNTDFVGDVINDTDLYVESGNLNSNQNELNVSPPLIPEKPVDVKPFRQPLVSIGDRNRRLLPQSTTTSLQKAKPKISISLNLQSSHTAHLFDNASGSKDTSADKTSELTYSSGQIPYPVINDKREIHIVYNDIYARKQDIEVQLSDVVFQLNKQAEMNPDTPDPELHKQADDFRSKIRRIDTQIDYIQTRKEIDKVKGRKCRTQKDKEEAKKQLDCLTNRMNRLHQTMKEANRHYLRALAAESTHTALEPEQLAQDQLCDTKPLFEQPIEQVGSTDGAQECKKEGLNMLKSKISDLLHGGNHMKSFPVPQKSQKKSSKKRNQENAAAESLQHQQQLQKRHEELMTMLKTDEDLNSKVQNRIESMISGDIGSDGDNPILRALGAEAKKRLGANICDGKVTGEEQEVRTSAIQETDHQQRITIDTSTVGAILPQCTTEPIPEHSFPDITRNIDANVYFENESEMPNRLSSTIGQPSVTFDPLSIASSRPFNMHSSNQNVQSSSLCPPFIPDIPPPISRLQFNVPPPNHISLSMNANNGHTVNRLPRIQMTFQTPPPPAPQPVLPIVNAPAANNILNFLQRFAFNRPPPPLNVMASPNRPHMPPVGVIPFSLAPPLLPPNKDLFTSSWTDNLAPNRFNLMVGNPQNQFNTQISNGGMGQCQPQNPFISNITLAHPPPVMMTQLATNHLSSSDMIQFSLPMSQPLSNIPESHAVADLREVEIIQSHQEDDNDELMSDSEDKQNSGEHTERPTTPAKLTYTGFDFKNKNQTDNVKNEHETMLLPGMCCGLFSTSSSNLSTLNGVCDKIPFETLGEINEFSKTTTEGGISNGGVCWAMNEISRFLAKMDTKYCIFGGPYVRPIATYSNLYSACCDGISEKDSFSACGTGKRIVPFSSLGSFLYKDMD